MPKTNHNKIKLCRCIIIGTIVSLLLFSCSKAPEAGKFVPPYPGKATVVESAAYSVALQAPVTSFSGQNASIENLEFGFCFYPDSSPSSPSKVIAHLDGKSFTATIEGLSTGITYSCTPYVRNGEFEVVGQSCKFAPANPFEDKIFWDYLIENFDRDKDSGLSKQEAESVTEITVPDMGISSLEGIELFPQLMHLYCQNNRLRKFDLSNNIYLTELVAERNMLEELDLRQNRELQTIVVWENHLTKIDVTGLEMVGTFWCWRNRLNEIDISSMKNLINFGCAQNAIKELDLSNNTKLINLAPNDTLIEELDLSHCPNLESLEIQGNNIMTEVDLTHCQKMRHMRSENCPNLRYIYINKGHSFAEILKDDHTRLIEK